MRCRSGVECACSSAVCSSVRRNSRKSKKKVTQNSHFFETAPMVWRRTDALDISRTIQVYCCVAADIYWGAILPLGVYEMGLGVSFTLPWLKMSVLPIRLRQWPNVSVDHRQTRRRNWQRSSWQQEPFRWHSWWSSQWVIDGLQRRKAIIRGFFRCLSRCLKNRVLGLGTVGKKIDAYMAQPGRA